MCGSVGLVGPDCDPTVDGQSGEFSRPTAEQVKEKKDEGTLADKQVVEGEMKHKSEKPLFLELPRIPLVSGLRRQTHDHLVRPRARPQSRPARTGSGGLENAEHAGIFPPLSPFARRWRKTL